MPDRVHPRQGDTIVDLRDGYRIEVEPMVFPAGEFGARLSRRCHTPGDRTTWKKVNHPLVLSNTAEGAARDLLMALNQGMLFGVEVCG